MNSIVKEKRYISERLGVPYESLSQSYLRAETNINIQTSKIDFTLQRNKATSTYVTERLLDLNDEFVITHFFVGLKSVDTSWDGSGVPLDPTDEQHLVAPVDTFECASKYFNSSCKAIYNGNLNFTIDRTEFIPEYPVSAFRRVPFQQLQRVFDSDGSQVYAGTNGFTNGLYGFANSEPTLINGRQTLDLSIDLGDSIQVSPTEGIYGAGFEDSPINRNKQYVVFEARGYLVTNAK